MSDRTQDLKNLRAVATACKNYVDETKEQILWQVGQYDITTQDDNTTAYQKVVPTGATRCKIKRIYGLTQKLNPTTASDNTSYSVKTMPATVYDFDISKVEGNSEKSENLITTFNSSTGTSHTFVDGVLTSSSIDSRSWNTYNVCDFQVYLQAGTYVIKLFDRNITTEQYQGAIICNESNQSVANLNVLSNTSGSEPITISTSGYYGFMFKFNGNFKPMLVSGSTAPTEYKQGFTGIHNFEWNGLVVKNSDDEVMQNISINLSSITYNGSPLFEGNSLKAVNDVKDSVTPYKATKKIIEIPLKDLDFSASSTASSGIFRAVLTAYNVKYNTGDTPVNALIDSYETMAFNPLSASDNMKFGIGLRSGTALTISMINQSFINDLNGFIASVQDKVLYAEMNSYIEVSINWASLLRGITGYSNGTISLLNTNNQDTANLITYNSIIKENCCAKMVQSRGGNVVKTINLPTQASDGYSAVSVANVRDFTTNKRETNVNKVDLGNGSYTGQYNAFYTYAFTGYAYQQGIVKFISAKYESFNYNGSLSNFVATDKSITFTSASMLWFTDKQYGTDVATAKTANAGNNLYYALSDASKTSTDITPIENVIEVQPGDELAFYDANDNLVTIQSDLTYRIEVAR